MQGVRSEKSWISLPPENSQKLANQGALPGQSPTQRRINWLLNQNKQDREVQVKVGGGGKSGKLRKQGQCFEH